MVCSCILIPISIASVVGYFVYKFIFKKQEIKEPELQVKNWERDVAYLFQFPRAKFAPNLSPYCVKLESFFRINNIKYEVRETFWGRSKYGLIPFIEFNGEHIADSQLIDIRMREHFKIENYSTKHNEAVGRAVDRMVDNFTFNLINKFKALDRMDEFINLFIDVMKPPVIIAPLLRITFKFVFGKKLRERIYEKVGPFPDEDFVMLFRKDMSAIAHILGNKKYLFGDKITSTDCSVFGQLAVIYYLPYPNEVQKILNSEFKQIVDFIERFRHEVYPNDFVK